MGTAPPLALWGLGLCKGDEDRMGRRVERPRAFVTITGVADLTPSKETLRYAFSSQQGAVCHMVC